MFSEPKSAPSLRAYLGLFAPLFLAHCGNVGGRVDVQAGAAGTSAESGAANGGAASGGVAAGGSDGGAASDSSLSGLVEPGLAGASAAGAADAGASGSAGGGVCAQELLTFSNPSAQHVSACSEITYSMNPPVYGDHYPVWAAYKSYSFPVPLGFLVHNLEHGAVELLYNCPQGCADEVERAQTFLDALPLDPRCTAEVKHQTILSPDPTLPSRWAAVAWGHSLTADCFDGAAFQSFYDANVGHGPEDLCTDGADLASDTCL